MSLVTNESQVTYCITGLIVLESIKVWIIVDIFMSTKYGSLFPNIGVTSHAVERFAERVLQTDDYNYFDVEKTVVRRFKDGYPCEDTWISEMGAKIDDDGVVYVFAKDASFGYEIRTCYRYNETRNTMITVPPFLQ